MCELPGTKMKIIKSLGKKAQQESSISPMFKLLTTLIPYLLFIVVLFSIIYYIIKFMFRL